jgi:hypothetical protein
MSHVLNQRDVAKLSKYGLPCNLGRFAATDVILNGHLKMGLNLFIELSLAIREKPG